MTLREKCLIFPQSLIWDGGIHGFGDRQRRGTKHLNSSVARTREYLTALRRFAIQPQQVGNLATLTVFRRVSSRVSGAFAMLGRIPVAGRTPSEQSGSSLGRLLHIHRLKQTCGENRLKPVPCPKKGS
jgi:hypothetical protein